MKLLIFIILLLLLLQDNIVTVTGINSINYIDEFLIIILVLKALSNISKTKKITKTTIILIACIVTFSCIGIYSCITNSQYELNNLIMGCFLAIKFWLLVISTSHVLKSDKIKTLFLECIIIIEKIVIAFALINLFLPNVYMSIFPDNLISYRLGLLAICSIFDHPGELGWFMLLCAIIHFSKYHSENNNKELKLSIISMIISLLSLRTKVIFGVMGCILFYSFFMDNNNIKEKVKKLFLAVIIIVICSFIFKDFITNTYDLYFTRNQGESARQALLVNSVKIAHDYFPIGVGFSKYATWYASLNYSEYYYQYNMSDIYGLQPNNSNYSTDVFWPAILGETGIIGTMIFAFMLIYVLKKLRFYYKMYPNTDKLSISFGLISILCLVQTFIESFGEASFNSAPQNIIVGLIVGMALSYENNKLKIEKGAKKI